MPSASIRDRFVPSRHVLHCWLGALLLMSGGLTTTAAVGQTIATIAGGLGYPRSLALDGQGNLFFSNSDSSSITHLGKIQTSGSQTQVTIFGQGELGRAGNVGVDASGNLFVFDEKYGTLLEYRAADQFKTPKTLAGGSGIQAPGAFALDSSGNIFFIVGTGVQELLAPDYTTVKSIGGNFTAPLAIAVDSDENVFVTDIVTDSVYEMVAEGGYATVKTLAGLFVFAAGVTVDRQGNVFVADVDGNQVYEIPAAGGYSAIQALGSGFDHPYNVAVDASGNVFVTEPEPGTLKEILAAGGYAAVVTLASGFDNPTGLAIDGAGNIILADTDDAAVDILSAASGYVGIDKVISGFPLDFPTGLAVDGAGNVFVSDEFDQSIKEILASSGYATLIKLPIRGISPLAVTLDRAGNLYFADGANVYEADAASGYATVKTLGIGLYYSADDPVAIAVDDKDNVFIATFGVVLEILAQDGSVRTLTTAFTTPEAMTIDGAGNLYLTQYGSDSVARIATTGDAVRIDYLGSGFENPDGAAVDSAGNVFVADTTHDAVREILATPPSLAASVLPGSRSVQIGTAATVFATLINAGSDTLQNCRVSLPPSPLTYGLTLAYQTTDPTTNALTGQPNTPVTLAGQGGSQSFLVSIQSTPQVTPPLPDLAQALDFQCDGAKAGTVEVAPVFPGVDTIDLSFSDTPTSDIIALAATPTNNGIVDVPLGGDAAFAVASIDVGTADQIVVSVDTGLATLPLTATICQTDPITAQCLAPPAATVAVTYSVLAGPTFSVFLHATGPIPFDPAASRVNVRFQDFYILYQIGRPPIPTIVYQERGLTSVAVETN